MIDRNAQIVRAIEKKIVRFMLETMKAEHGYWFAVLWDGVPARAMQNVNDAMTAIFAVDQCSIRFYENRENGYRGSVLLVRGNYGWDVICDYSTKIESEMKSINDYAESIHDYI